MAETVDSEINCQSLRQDKPEHHSAKNNWLYFQVSVTSNDVHGASILKKDFHQDKK